MGCVDNMKDDIIVAELSARHSYSLQGKVM